MSDSFETTVQESAGGVDWHLLARQKQAVLELASNPAIDPHYRELFAGLVHFLDNYQDTAADQLGLPVVFLTEEGFKDKDGNGVAEPPREEHGFVAAVRKLLDAADDDAPDGLVVLPSAAYAEARQAFHEVTGTFAGFEPSTEPAVYRLKDI